MINKVKVLILLLFVSISLGCGNGKKTAEISKGKVYEVVEIDFFGPSFNPEDAPTENVDFWAEFQHQDGSETFKIHGFWDGDGKGGKSGNVFSIRFCPTKSGKWYLSNVYSNQSELNDQHEGHYVSVSPSELHGFWLVDEKSAGGRWFKRSDDSHQYIIGNTHYDFLSRPNGIEASESSISKDIEDNALRMKKLRFCLQSFRDENMSLTVLPFVDETGKPQNSEKTHGHRINPEYWHNRVDIAVNKAFGLDLICDLILGGTVKDQAVHNRSYVKYVVARYGAYPNVWITVGQEWNEQVDANHEKEIGTYVRELLAYPIPLSTHATSGWDPALNGDWCTHSILQGKIKDVSKAAMALIADYEANGGKPCVNDENGYDPGEDTELDIIEGIMGTFSGGGYGSTGHKTASKKGGYFWGHHSQNSTIGEHPSTDNLKMMMDFIDSNLHFWNHEPVEASSSIFSGLSSSFRALEWPGWEYVFFSNQTVNGIKAQLPEGYWTIKQIDLVSKKVETLADNSSGEHTFSTPASRASITLFVSNDTVQMSVASKAQRKSGLEGKTKSSKAENMIQVRKPSITTVSSDLDKAQINKNYADDIEAAGGDAPLTWSASDLPEGLTLSSSGGTLSGIPLKSGTFRFTVTVTDKDGDIDQKELTIVVEE